MDNTDHNNAKNKEISDYLETDFGDRKISDQNFSKIIALPKGALVNCANPVKVNVRLVYHNETRYIKLTPIQFKDLHEI